MKTLIFLTVGVFLFLGGMYLLFKKIWAEKALKKGDSIAKKLEAIEKDKKESSLGKGLFYKIKSSIFKKR